ncbi:STAS domain-containing protein [Saccharopolyspora sp. K220]|uniref:STAS domain-containing protein n=1 Tax=Saccharopolyspora soli TaxID=2926618 RepID=UPI001F5A1F4B|nr:STAS domain-containing protein [Saccharopolyspora soli]MCI2423436.1 STAS domain-containing protein [Saccharopolyspora soli]
MPLEHRVPGSLADEAPEVALHDSISKAPAPSVQVSFPRPDTIVVAVSAPVDRDTVDKLETMLFPQPPSAARLVIVDLTNMYELNVPDLQLLTYAHMLTQARGGTLRVVAANRAIQEALHAAGLNALLECHATIQTALAPTTTTTHDIRRGH